MTVRKLTVIDLIVTNGCLMAMSYSYELQAKVFDRMTALEEKAAGQQFELPKTLSSALRLATAQAEQIEQSQVVVEQRSQHIEWQRPAIAPRCPTGLHSRARLRFQGVGLVLVSPGWNGGRRGAGGMDQN